MKRCLMAGVACAGMMVAALGWAQEQLDDYAQQLPLELSGEGPWYRLDIPMALHFAANYGDLRDLRVFNGEGQALAYALVAGQGEARASQQEHRVKWFPLYAGEGDDHAVPSLRVQRGTGGTLIELLDEPAQAKPAVLRGWLLDASAVDDSLVQLQLDWSGPQEGFQRFTIEASDDLKSWRPWGTGQLARLSFADERVEQRHVELPGQKARYLRLLWQNPEQAPQLTAASLRSQRTETAPAPLVWSQTLAATHAANGEYHWHLPKGLPLQRMQVELSQPNSLAPVRVSGRSEEKTSWQPLAQGLLYRLPESGDEIVQDELTLPGWPVQQLRVQVDERGGGLGRDPQIKVALRASQLVFLQRGSPPYRLALGRANVQSAALPLTTLIPGYQPQRLQQLGSAEVQLPAADALVQKQSAAPKQDWRRWGLWLVLLLGVGLLAAMAFSVSRRPSTE
ncbi:DUF3999 domain-containing protein [Pseudomonas sp. TTU2014-080ASC]|uniref:DUF3999 domain-containing protein n=1 Tax=Pseudomonas sp. TTU2014-080ASC TaxID=1729724 RepID=UPI000718A39B|nr:DUF3999 domain-containing protein [Pseudomonas sp. TTU2014-080ASC]KRW58980.1 hypothetical protein AO726_15845 [Pseudomonas sp. TTU2014-080ASC]